MLRRIKNHRKSIIWIAGLALVGCATWSVFNLFQNGTVLRLFRHLNPLPRTVAMQEDLHFLVRRMSQVHPDLYFALSEGEFAEAVKQIEMKIPKLTDDEYVAELMRLVTLPGRVGGRDGHSYIPLFQEQTGFHAFPLRLYLFSDGWFVIDAREPYEELIGNQLMQIGEIPIDEAYALMESFVSRDNGATVVARIGRFFLVPELLHVAGIVEQSDTANFVLKDSENQIVTVNLEPIVGATYENWEDTWSDSWSRPDIFTFDYLEESKTLHIQYNQVRAKTSSGETLTEMSNRIAATVEEQDVEHVVVDVRENGGGNNFTYKPLYQLLTKNPTINQPETLFIVTSRATFSAAGNFVTGVVQNSDALVVGEPMGGGLNQYGDNIAIVLPNSQLHVRIASKYWQKSTPDDERLTIAPDIPVEVNSADYFAGRDAAIDAIISYKEGE